MEERYLKKTLLLHSKRYAADFMARIAEAKRLAAEDAEARQKPGPLPRARFNPEAEMVQDTCVACDAATGEVYTFNLRIPSSGNKERDLKEWCRWPDVEVKAEVDVEKLIYFETPNGRAVDMQVYMARYQLPAAEQDLVRKAYKKLYGEPIPPRPKPPPLSPLVPQF